MNTKKIFVINGGQVFAHSGGALNKTILDWDKGFFTQDAGFELQTTDINDDYNAAEEVQKFVWADVIIYHFPIWWFSLPHKLKEYLDKVFTEGHRNGMYYSDGRKMDNPDRNYGKGGLMQGRKYMVTTSWNAPAAAFTLPDEFFQEKSVDEGILFGFHRMNAFLSLAPLKSMHFHDVEKNMNDERLAAFRHQYHRHLEELFKQQNN